MKTRGFGRVLCALVTALLSGTGARAQINVGSDGSDGVLNVTSSIEIDLGLAATGSWTDPSPVAGQGVYDPDQWAVVFKYSSVNINAGRTVTFKNHPSRAPVVWLVQGNATIAGTVYVNGQAGHPHNTAYYLSEPGPGGFRGGRTWLSPTAQEVAGLGPGGARSPAVDCGGGWGGSFGSIPTGSGATGSPGPIYGNALVMPLLGGSGGAGVDLGTCPQLYSGSGAGGGAILIAAGSTFALSGGIYATGGDASTSFGAGSAGSGGSIRIVANAATGTGLLRAKGGTSAGSQPGRWGAKGRIRVEANAITLADPGDPQYSFGLPGDPAMIFPPALSPRVRCVSVGAAPVPADPRASLGFPLSDVSMASPSPVTIVVEGENVPLNWSVEVRMVPTTSGTDVAVLATLQPGSTEALSTWHAQMTFPNGFAAVQARAFQP